MNKKELEQAVMKEVWGMPILDEMTVTGALRLSLARKAIEVCDDTGSTPELFALFCAGTINLALYK